MRNIINIKLFILTSFSSFLFFLFFFVIFSIKNFNFFHNVIHYFAMSIISYLINVLSHFNIFYFNHSSLYKDLNRWFQLLWKFVPFIYFRELIFVCFYYCEISIDTKIFVCFSLCMFLCLCQWVSVFISVSFPLSLFLSHTHTHTLSVSLSHSLSLSLSLSLTQIGRASCRERVFRRVYISVVAV